MIDEIKICLQESLKNAEIHVTSDDGKHFTAVVIAPQFAEKSLVEQHRLVMEPLSQLFASTLHAFQLKTYTPAEWQAVKGKLHD